MHYATTRYTKRAAYDFDIDIHIYVPKTSTTDQQAHMRMHIVVSCRPATWCGSAEDPSMCAEQQDSSNFREPTEVKSPRNQWETREGMMSEEEVAELSAEKGQAEIGLSRAGQAGEPGPNAEAPSRPGGRRGEPDVNPKGKPIGTKTSSEDWTKYDWASDE
jgi:hypothetical protein